MRHKEDVALALQLHHDRLQARHQVLRNIPDWVNHSVADPGCLSRILIFTQPGIPDLGSKNGNKREVWKKFVVIPFFVATNLTNFKIILFLNCWRKKLASFQRITELFTQKFVTKLSKIWVWDPGSGKNPAPFKTVESEGHQKGSAE